MFQPKPPPAPAASVAALRTYLPMVLQALTWLNDPAALRAFLTSLANQSETVSGAFRKVNASDILARALQGQVGPELKAMGLDLLKGLGGPLMAAGMAASAAAGRK